MLDEKEITRAVKLSQAIDEEWNGTAHEYLAELSTIFNVLVAESRMEVQDEIGRSAHFIYHLRRIFCEYEAVELF